MIAGFICKKADSKTQMHEINMRLCLLLHHSMRVEVHLRVIVVDVEGLVLSDCSHHHPDF
jgi:hypothetical protein